MNRPLSRRSLLRNAAITAAAYALPLPLSACESEEVPREPFGEIVPPEQAVDPDRARLAAWTKALRTEGQTRAPLGRSATLVGELAAGTPYEAFTLEEYLRTGGSPLRTEPLTLSLTRFDCVTLVESCLAVARVAAAEGAPSWERFAREVERMRYRGGERREFTSRLHYFSEWISDGDKRGLLRDIGSELGGVVDARPLRFMTEHRKSYPALADDTVFREIGAMERRLDAHPRRVVPTERIAKVADSIETGDVLGFATGIPGLDVTHSAFAYRDSKGNLLVLHAPLSGGAVEVTSSTLPEYVAAIRRSTGILVARPLKG